MANLIVAPLVGFVLIPLAVVSSFAYLLSGFYLFGPLVSMVADMTVALVKRFSEIPRADIALPNFPPILCVSPESSAPRQQDLCRRGVSPQRFAFVCGDFGRTEQSIRHPDGEMLGRLSDAQVVRSDRDGAIKVLVNDDGLVVKTYRDHSLEPSESLSAEWSNIQKLASTW